MHSKLKYMCHTQREHVVVEQHHGQHSGNIAEM